jgi:hypothetical protein
MPTLKELARQYNANVVIVHGLLIVSVDIKSESRVDIGFSRRNRPLWGKVLPCLSWKIIREDLYACGGSADNWIPYFSIDDDLCNSLSILLERYAFRVEWTGSRLTARINMLLATPDGDSTGGDRFFTTLVSAASRLEIIGKRNKPMTGYRTAAVCGPARFRKIMFWSVIGAEFLILLMTHHIFSR